MVAFLAIAAKCSYDEWSIPRNQKAELIAAYPEIKCDTAQLSVTKPPSNWESGPYILEVKGEPACIDSIRMSLTKRGYERDRSRNEWYLKDGYWAPGTSNPTVMFDFKSDDRVLWIREWQ
jgi:hypothetical protein